MLGSSLNVEQMIELSEGSYKWIKIYKETACFLAIYKLGKAYIGAHTIIGLVA